MLLIYSFGFALLRFLIGLKKLAFYFDPMDLFNWYVLFSHFRQLDVTLGNSFFQMPSYARAYVRITFEKTQEKFRWKHHVV